MSLFLALSLLTGCSKSEPDLDPFSLRSLPSVASVDVSLNSASPTLTVLHLLDWHFIPRDLYAAELRASNADVSDQEIDNRYQQFLDDVRAVKRDQAEVLRYLAEQGVTVVYQEGLTPDDAEAFVETSVAVSRVDRSDLVESVDRAQKLVTQPNASEEASTMFSFAQLALKQYDRDMLTVGAAGELLASGVLDEVRPLEDAELLADADPIQADGTAALDQPAQERRDRAITKTLLNCEAPVAVVILGGAHDLAEVLNRENRQVRYIRVETHAYRAAGHD